jgi:hypothetical protein
MTPTSRRCRAAGVLGLLAALTSLAAPSVAQGECSVTFVNPGSAPLWLHWVKQCVEALWPRTVESFSPVRLA